MEPRRSPRLALVLSALWPGLGSLLVGQPILGLLLMAAALASLLSTLVFYGYVTTPVVWAFGLLAAWVGARRRALGRPRWPARRLRWTLVLGSLAAAGLVLFHLGWSAPRAPGRQVTLRGGPPLAPSQAVIAWSGPGGTRRYDLSGLPRLSVNELGHLRWWMALATQPLGQWEGFYSIDQFGQTALRYQLAFAAYGLAQAQVARLPAYRGPIPKALEALVEKMLHPDVWSYWRWESLASFDSWTEDPVAWGNVMYSGHLASMVGLARLLTGEPLYEGLGSLAFILEERPVAYYSYRTLLERLAYQFRKNPWHAITCEPHQAFIMCNNHAALGLVLGARLLVEPSLREAAFIYARSYRKLFLSPDGGPKLRYPYYTPLGRALPFHLVFGDGWAIATLHGLLPREARRLYGAYRGRIFRPSADGPGALLSAPIYERLDVGNMRISSASQLVFALLAAREMGDEALARELLATIESRYGPRWIGGRRTYRDLSPLLHGVAFLAQMTPPGGLRVLFTEAEPARIWQGPHLVEVLGGELDVIQAAYDPRARVLIVGLVAGQRPTQRVLRIGGLDPKGRYSLVVNGRVAAARARPSADGTLRLPVPGSLPVRALVALNPKGP